MNVLQALSAVIDALGHIEVKGKENINTLLGAIVTVEKIRDALTAPKGEESNATD